MNYIVTTDTYQVTATQQARLYRRISGHQYQLSAQGVYSEMEALAKSLNEDGE